MREPSRFQGASEGSKEPLTAFRCLRRPKKRYRGAGLDKDKQMEELKEENFQVRVEQRSSLKYIFADNLATSVMKRMYAVAETSMIAQCPPTFWAAAL